MGRRSAEGPWRLNGSGCVTAMQVAHGLLTREAMAGLSYRDVAIEAQVVDVAHAEDRAAANFYRFFLLRPVAWPTEPPPAGHHRPAGWSSEVLLLPRGRGDGIMDRLTPFEAQFAVRSFLHRVEREIDGVLRRAEDHNHTWARS